MNRRMVFSTVGKIIAAVAALLTLPFVVSLLYREDCAWSFLITIGIALSVGLLLMLIFRPGTKVIYAKDGFVITALAWVAFSVVGSLPFLLSGEIKDFSDAFFETVSGFTTTGATILVDVESMSNGLLFWRSFTHWIGGMGVLVFVLAVTSFSDRSIHIMRAEMPGPVVGKLVPRAKQTAKILYIIYICMTFLEIILLKVGGMTWFESSIHAFGAAGTGGFGIMQDSMAGYSNFCQWVITIFMFLFGINFNLYFLLLIKKFRAIFKSGELWCYLGIVLVSTAIVTANILPLYDNLYDSIRLSSFQVSSIISTTGFSTANYDSWPMLSKGILFVLMFIGGCAGSTAGGLKVSRIILLFKSIKRELTRMLHPRSVSRVRIEGKSLDDTTVSNVTIYFAIYMIGFFLFFLILCFDGFSFTTNLSAVAACFNNVGPGFAGVGPNGCYAGFSALSKIVLSFAMLFGRLEIFPLLFALTPSTWTKK